MSPGQISTSHFNSREQHAWVLLSSREYGTQIDSHPLGPERGPSPIDHIGQQHFLGFSISSRTFQKSDSKKRPEQAPLETVHLTRQAWTVFASPQGAQISSYDSMRLTTPSKHKAKGKHIARMELQSLMN